MYITIRTRKAPPKQMSFTDLFNMIIETDWTQEVTPYNHSYSRSEHSMTYKVPIDKLPGRLIDSCNVTHMIYVLERFVDQYGHLRDELPSHYSKFYIPKKSGGLREINQPDDQLSNCLRELKDILEREFRASHHTCAYAYVKGRSTKDALQVHQYNESKWFLKTDISGFFPSTTLEFVIEMLKHIYPFGLVMRDEHGADVLSKALSLCFLNGGLPMGTPISPMLTNLIMIPFDYEISKYLRARYQKENNSDGRGRRFAYTRYADDMHISCRIDFNPEEVVREIRSLFAVFHAPYQIKREKTHYGSSSGKNWMLGLMLNKDNKITIGHKKKREFESMLFNYGKARTSGCVWTQDQLHYMLGLISYYRMVNRDDIDNVIATYGRKFGMDIEATIKSDLNA